MPHVTTLHSGQVTDYEAEANTYLSAAASADAGSEAERYNLAVASVYATLALAAATKAAR